MLKRFVPRLCAVTTLVVASTVAHATPDDDDPIGRLLHERGWIGDGAEPASTAPGRVSNGRRTVAAVKAVGARSASLARKTRDRTAVLVAAAKGLMGVPYVHGGTSVDTGFDCSGFTRHVFQRALGLALPRSSREQAEAPGLVQVGMDDLRPGDLVFFNTMRTAFSHVGIYVGNNKFIHAPRTGGQIRVEDLRVAYWAQRFDGGRRPQSMAETATASAAGATMASGLTH